MVVAGAAAGKAVSHRGRTGSLCDPAGGPAPDVGVVSLCLYTDDADRGVDLLCVGGNAGDQAAAAHRHRDGIQEGQVLQHFHGDGALTGHDQRVFVGMHNGVAMLLHLFPHLFPALDIQPVPEDHTGSHAPGVVRLQAGRVIRQDDGYRDPQLLPGIGTGLAVISGGAGDDAPGTFLRRQGQDLAHGAPQLECAGDLQHFRLQIDVTAQELPHGLLPQQRCVADVGSDALRSGFNVFQSHDLRFHRMASLVFLFGVIISRETHSYNYRSIYKKP